MQIIQIEEDLTSYSVGSCSKYRGIVLVSSWYIPFGCPPQYNIQKWNKVVYQG